MSDNVRQNETPKLTKTEQFSMRMPLTTLTTLKLATQQMDTNPSRYVLRAAQRQLAEDLTNGRFTL